MRHLTLLAWLRHGAARYVAMQRHHPDAGEASKHGAAKMRGGKVAADPRLVDLTSVLHRPCRHPQKEFFPRAEKELESHS